MFNPNRVLAPIGEFCLQIHLIVLLVMLLFPGIVLLIMGGVAALPLVGLFYAPVGVVAALFWKPVRNRWDYPDWGRFCGDDLGPTRDPRTLEEQESATVLDAQSGSRTLPPI